MNNIVDKFPWRDHLLAAIGIGIGMVAIYSFIEPKSGNYQVSSFKFPPHLDLESWQQIDRQSKRHVSLAEENTESVAVANYQYQQTNLGLQVETRYLVGTNGDVPSYIDEYTDLDRENSSGEKIAEIENIGYHYLFTSSDRAFLSSCISPRSPSNVTSKQFSLNRYYYNLKPQVWWHWLWGKASIHDRRCLWTHLSIAIDDSNVQMAYETLEAAWVDWYRWWQPRFPSL
ncbi:cyanoexosortase A system-associated protein [Myxosarcina sp. GI1(2024)]